MALVDEAEAEAEAEEAVGKVQAVVEKEDLLVPLAACLACLACSAPPAARRFPGRWAPRAGPGRSRGAAV